MELEAMYRKGVTAKQIEHKTMIQKFLHIAIYMLVFTRMDYSTTLVRVFTEGTLSGQLFTLCTQLFTLTIYKVSFHKKIRLWGLCAMGVGYLHRLLPPSAQ